MYDVEGLIDLFFGKVLSIKFNELVGRGGEGWVLNFLM